MIFELVSNIPSEIDTEKKLLSKDDVDPQLKAIPMEQYRVVLEGKEKDEILGMYLALHEDDRRRFNISMQSVYGALTIAFWTGIVTTLYEQYKEIGNSEVINI